MAAKNDEDLAPFRQEMRAHIRVVNALLETQIEQDQTLVAHGVILARHTATLDQHTATLGEHSVKLDWLTEKVDGHTAILDQQSKVLGTLVAGQAKIMKHLSITDNGEA